MTRQPSLAPKKDAARRVVRITTLALCCLMLTAPASLAQNAGGLGGFLQNLFRFGRPEPQAAPNAPLRARAHRIPHKRGQDTRAPGTPGGAPVVKPSFFVTVLGDSLAINAAQGLGEAFAAKPEVAITDLARDLSGLVREDYFDWPKAARDLMAAKKPVNVAVVMMGINDIQPLKDGGGTLDPLSDRWRAAYGTKIDALLAPFRDAHLPVLWVGLPPMRDERLNGQAAALNEIYRDRVDKAGGTYVDIWDAFSDPTGQYTDFGPDAEGQNAKLRKGPGGIYFTKAGARKIAQFLEPDIRRELDKSKPPNVGSALPPDIKQEATAVNAEILEKGADARISGAAIPLVKPPVGPIVSLTALPASPGGVLVNPADAVSFRSAGPARDAPAGRADSFPWPPH